MFLAYETPARWAALALADPLALLSDHAYLERKAASNALELLNRWPEPRMPENWTSALAGVARDEAAHLQMVIRLLRRKGGHLQRLHRSRYAADLRALVRRGQGPEEIVDRLLISGLIEARSAERFSLLASHAEDSELAVFYKRLWSSEVGHHKIFLQLAEDTVSPKEARQRWKELQQAEAEIIRAQPPGPCLHSGLG